MMVLPMLIDASSPFRGFMGFINKKKLCDTPCNVVILPDYDSVKHITIKEDGSNIGFALYLPDSCTMYVAGDMSSLEGLETEEDRQIAIMTSIAHEYIHHIQNVE